MMKIDIFCHIFPKNFYDRMLVLPERGTTIKKRVTEIPSLIDLDVRFRMMDEFRDYIQVPCMPLPPIEALADPQKSPELAALANDGRSEERRVGKEGRSRWDRYHCERKEVYVLNIVHDCGGVRSKDL